MSNIRKRLMMSGGIPSPYPDPWEDDGYIWAYYDVTSTAASTSLFYSSFSNLSAFGAYFIIDGTTVNATTSYLFNTTGEHLVKILPATVNIPENAFRSVSSLKRLYLPDSITGVDKYGIAENSSLTHLWLSEEITTIGNYGLYSNTALEVVNLYLPKLTTLSASNANYGFNFRYSLMPKGVIDFPQLTTISGKGVFANTSIIEVKDLGSVTTLPSGNGTGAFQSCASLKKVVLPGTITSLGSYCFNGCSKLESINLPKTITSLGRDAFRGTLITNVIDLPNLTGTLNGSFYGTHITEIKDLGSVTSLQGTSGAGGFRNCTHLTKAVIPSTMTNMSNGFNGCSSLEEITIYATTPPTYSGTLNACSSLTHIYVPAASVEAYKTATGWSGFSSIISAIPTT